MTNVVRLQRLHHGVGFDVAADVADNHDGQLSDEGDPFFGVQLTSTKARDGLGDVGLGGAVAVAVGIQLQPKLLGTHPWQSQWHRQSLPRF